MRNNDLQKMEAPHPSVHARIRYPKISDCGSQKSPSKPRRAKMERISSGCGRREFSCKRVEYQVVASDHSWSIVTSGRMRSQFPNFFDLKLREAVSHGL